MYKVDYLVYPIMPDGTLGTIWQSTQFAYTVLSVDKIQSLLEKTLKPKKLHPTILNIKKLEETHHILPHGLEIPAVSPDEVESRKTRIERMVNDEEITLTEVIDAIISINGIIGVGIISLKDQISNYMDRKLKGEA
jgi:hypothetical protein